MKKLIKMYYTVKKIELILLKTSDFIDLVLLPCSL